MFLVLRTMFDVPDKPGYGPEMWVGAPHPSAPPDKKLIPRFPVALEADIPLLLVHGYALAGEPQGPEEHVDYYRQHGRLRAHPLHPTNKPMDALTALASSPAWKTLAKDDEENYLDLLRHEILNLLDSVYQPERERLGRPIPFGTEAAAQRQKILNDVSALKIRWNVAENQYTFLDGRSLPQRHAKIYRRLIWIPEVPGCEVKYALERLSSRDVRVCITEKVKADGFRPELSFKLFRIGSGQVASEIAHEVHTEIVDHVPYRATSTQDMELPEGAQVQIELSVKDKKQMSPVFKP
jgi:hypothetical protein